MGPCRMIVIRHGETGWNLAGRMQGHVDSPLDRIRPAPGSCRRPTPPRDAPRCRGLQPCPQLRERKLGIVEGLTWQDFGHMEDLLSTVRPAP